MNRRGITAAWNNGVLGNDGRVTALQKHFKHIFASVLCMEALSRVGIKTSSRIDRLSLSLSLLVSDHFDMIALQRCCSQLRPLTASSCLYGFRESSQRFLQNAAQKTSATANNNNGQVLSNRKKFLQVAPPASLYDKLERLGFGSLRKTKRFSSVIKEKERMKRKVAQKAPEDPEPEYTVGYKMPVRVGFR